METGGATYLEPERHTAFDASHPVVPAAYLAGALLLTMFGLEPILVATSLVGALSLSLLARGVRATRRTLAWLVPMALLITLINPLFSSSGATLLVRVGRVKVYGESLAFGACMGGLFCATVLWCESAVRVLTHDRLLALAGGATPVVALMVSMTSRLVPQILGRYREVADARSAATVAAPSGALGGLRARVSDVARTSGVLLAWSLSDSLDTADSMRARGWASTPHRTSYRPFRLTRTDVLALVGVLALLALAAWCAWTVAVPFHFYPHLSAPAAAWRYLPCAAYVALPSALHAREALSWRG